MDDVLPHRERRGQGCNLRPQKLVEHDKVGVPMRGGERLARALARLLIVDDVLDVRRGILHTLKFDDAHLANRVSDS